VKVHIHWSDGSVTTYEASHVERTVAYTLVTLPKKQVYPYTTDKHQIPYTSNVMEIVVEEDR
jgi:hypothetical protein